MAGRTALVTGANRGLGLETSKQLAERGFRVIMTSRSDRSAARALEERGLEVTHRPLDVADRRSIDALAEQLKHDGESLELLVNNAGIALKGFDADVVRKTFDVNYFGAMHTTDALVPLMRDGGAVVMVSSGLGELAGLAAELIDAFADPELGRDDLDALMRSFIADVERGTHRDHGWPSSGYRVSKIGLNALTRILARELAPRRIRVNAVCPGWVRTGMGGSSAPRSVEEGAASIIATAVSEKDATGTFFRDGVAIDW